jgi:hypothetical protein
MSRGVAERFAAVQSAGQVAAELGAFVRHARRLPAFVRQTVTPEQAVRRIEQQLRVREATFLTVLERSVYHLARSPYRPLLRAAGAEFGDVAALVRNEGLEVALARLYDAGVRVTLDEFKGRIPLERIGVSFAPTHHAFDNPLLTKHFETRTGGSRGARRRMSVDLDRLEHETAHHALFFDAFGLWGRPYGLWRAIPPAGAGMNNSLRHVKVGEPVAVWFTPYKAPPGLEAVKFAMFTAFTVRAGRLLGARLATPQHCPPDDAVRVARWLADQTRLGTPAYLDAPAGLGIRACLAARSEGLDITGTFFRFGGEPYTEEKAAVVAATGGRAVCHYAMGEAGRIAAACAAPESFDDMHFFSDKLAVLQRDKAVGRSGMTVGAFHYTSLLPSAPKVMINVESDDYGVLTDRRCGCPLGEAGLTTHMRRIRSYEKLTSEGNHFLGSDLLALLERVLPARFGGEPGDYQLVEEEAGGLPKVSVVARPRLGELDEQEVVSAVLDYLRSVRRNQLMADLWRDGDTLRLVRREPYMTAAGKILPLHLAARD